jgi:hypothetical protein
MACLVVRSVEIMRVSDLPSTGRTSGSLGRLKRVRTCSREDRDSLNWKGYLTMLTVFEHSQSEE